MTNSLKALLAALSMAMMVNAAHAHAHLQTAEPAVGSTIQAPPTEIRIRFSEGVEPAFSGITLTTSGGAAIAVEKAAVDPQNDALMVIKIDKPLAPDTYKVDWHAVAVDTHRTEGSFTFTVAAAGAPAPAAAQDFRGGGIIVEQPWSRATPKGAPVAGGYMVIHNNGKTEDRLTGGTFAEAGKVQIHQMSMENGIMKMRELPNGLAIPPGGTVTLDPDGSHIMFMDLKGQLTPGEVVEGELDFEHAGKIVVEYRVGGMGDKGPGGGTGPMGGSMPMSGSGDMDMPMH
jgi:hypothetical protein